MPRKRAAPAREADFVYIDDSDDDWEAETVQPAKKKQGPRSQVPAPIDLTSVGEPAPKQHKKKQAAAGEPAKAAVVEKRQASFRPKPSQKIRERMDRALSRGSGAAHRMYLIDHQPVASSEGVPGAARKFVVLGATGNVYDVTLDTLPSCTCPDHQNHRDPCKHMLFVMLRVLKLGTDNPLAWQKALLRGEVADVLVGAHSSAPGGSLDAVVAAAEVREAYARATAGGGAKGVAGPGPSAAAGGVQQRVEDSCSICFEDLEEGGGRAEATVWCSSSCGKTLHAACFKKWAGHKRAIGAPVTCPLCRHDWPSGAGGGGRVGGDGDAGKYVNLAQGGGQQSLQALYGSTAGFIAARRGNMNFGVALAMHQAME